MPAIPARVSPSAVLDGRREIVAFISCSPLAIASLIFGWHAPTGDVNPEENRCSRCIDIAQHAAAGRIRTRPNSFTWLLRPEVRVQRVCWSLRPDRSARQVGTRSGRRTPIKGEKESTVD